MRACTRICVRGYCIQVKNQEMNPQTLDHKSSTLTIQHYATHWFVWPRATRKLKITENQLLWIYVCCESHSRKPGGILGDGELDQKGLVSCEEWGVGCVEGIYCDFCLKWCLGEFWMVIFVHTLALHCNASNIVLEILKHDEIWGTVCISILH